MIVIIIMSNFIFSMVNIIIIMMLLSMIMIIIRIKIVVAFIKVVRIWAGATRVWLVSSLFTEAHHHHHHHHDHNQNSGICPRNLSKFHPLQAFTLVSPFLAHQSLTKSPPEIRIPISDFPQMSDRFPRGLSLFLTSTLPTVLFTTTTPFRPPPFQF